MSTANKPPLASPAATGVAPPADDVEEQGALALASAGTITRQELALAIFNRIEGVSRREAKRIVDSVIDEMVSALTGGESLKLHDFGSFLVREKHERSGRNPRTGAPVPIHARRVVVFKASPNMKAAINGDPPPRRGAKAAARRMAAKQQTGVLKLDAVPE